RRHFERPHNRVHLGSPARACEARCLWPLAAPRQCRAALPAPLPAESASVAGPELSSIPREAREKGRGAPSASAAHYAIKRRRDPASRLAEVPVTSEQARAIL